MFNTVYVFNIDGCKTEGMSKEQILAAIAEATGATVTDIDNAFISKVVNQNNGGVVKFWRGTTAEYNALTDKDAECYYIITDDNSKAEIDALVENLNNSVNALSNVVNALNKDVNEQAEKIQKNADAIATMGKVEGTLTATAGRDGEEIGTLKYIKSGNVIQMYGSVGLVADDELTFPTVYLNDNDGEFIKPTDGEQEFPVVLKGTLAESENNDGIATLDFYSTGTYTRFDVNGFNATAAAKKYIARINIVYLI